MRKHDSIRARRQAAGTARAATAANAVVRGFEMVVFGAVLLLAALTFMVSR